MSPLPLRALIGSVAAGAVLAAAAATQAQAPGEYVNATVGGPLRAGVYGQVLVRHGPPPPLISNRPVVAVKALGPVRGEPMYIYVPPGHVRKWVKYCKDYRACERPVYFVRMDNNPGKLGSWKTRVKPPERQGVRPPAGAGERF
jgi:hypothetical protein